MQTFTPGIHGNVPAEIYHAQPGVSNSGLKIFAELPAYYPASKLEPVEETDSMRRGTLLHLCVLEPNRYCEGQSHWTRPDGMKFTTTEGKAWKAKHEGLPILTAEEERNIRGAAKAIYANATAAALLTGKGSNECSVFAQHPKTGLTLRMRADRLTEDANGRPWIVDIKSCPDVKKFALSARDFKYQNQAVFYEYVMGLAGHPGANFVFIAVEIEPTYGIHGVRLVMPDEDTKEEARQEVEGLLVSFSECEKSDVWPGYSQEIDWIRVPKLRTL